jgi:CubicO group peptidase (beta-lactamase class C family)
MHSTRAIRRLMMTLCLAAATALATAAMGAPRSGDGAAVASKDALQEQASHFWQAVAAAPDRRPALLERYFSPGIRERNGDAGLLESLAMLSEALASDVAVLPEPEVMQGEQGPSGELRYTLPTGRRLSLTLSLTGGDSPRIDRFGLRPLPPRVAVVAPAQLPAVIGERVKAESAAGRFSGAVLVARGDEVIYAGAVGLADRTTGRINTLDTPFNLGSINKMFTAIAIAQLQAAGKLDWQDTVGRHLPRFPNPTIRDRVTIHQLLTHTSGVGSYWNEAHDARKHEIDTQQEFLQTFVDEPLRFAPGAGLEYSNGGPVILGLVVEALGGTDYYRYIREHIYRPAGMTHADHHRRDDAKSGVALGYLQTKEGDWQDNGSTLSLRGSAAGGGYASVRDLLAFSRALSNERLLTRAQLETLWTPHNRMGPMGYGYLFSIGGTPGRRWVGHNGGAPGISAEFLHYPEDGLAIIVLANQDRAAEGMREWLHAQVEASLFETNQTQPEHE